MYYPESDVMQPVLYRTGVVAHRSQELEGSCER